MWGYGHPWRVMTARVEKDEASVLCLSQRFEKRTSCTVSSSQSIVAPWPMDATTLSSGTVTLESSIDEALMPKGESIVPIGRPKMVSILRAICGRCFLWGSLTRWFLVLLCD